MGLSSKRLVIDSADFLKGVASSQFSKDGFFTLISGGLNLSAYPGILYPASPSTVSTTSSPGTFIASYVGTPGVTGKIGYFITSTGKWWTMDATYALTNDQTDGAKSYIDSTTDIVMYKSGLYTTSNDNITLSTIDGSGNLSATNNNWWVGTKGQTSNTGCPHPLLVYENTLWYGNYHVIGKWDGTTASSIVLFDTDVQITCLASDPGSGKMMIATSQGANFSNTLKKVNKIHFWDGYSTRPLRSVTVDGQVDAIHVVGGTIYITYDGYNLGYWNGSGITFLRRLRFIPSYSTSYIPVKNRITSIGNALYIVEGTVVTAYEAPMGGAPKVFYQAYLAVTSASSIQIIANIGSDVLAVAYNDTFNSNIDKLVTFNTKTAPRGTAHDGFSCRTKIYDFLNKVSIKMIRISFIDPIPNGTAPLNLSVYSPDQASSMTMEQKSNTNSANVYTLDYYPNNTALKIFDGIVLSLGSTSSNFWSGIRKIEVYYDDVE